MNAEFKAAQATMFEVGDMVIIFLRQEWFPFVTYGKLQPRKYGFNKILQRINPNAYVVDLPESLDIFHTFNVVEFVLV